MGYYYDWLESRWIPIDHNRVLTREQRQRIVRRGNLIADLIEEIEADDSSSVLKLFAGLAARALAASDELLLRDWGEQLAKIGPPQRDGGRAVPREP
jgi:hypothetical protein